MSSLLDRAVKQVVGLTASPGAGNANTVEMAVEHVLELCANMDATEISTVRDEMNRAEMMMHIQQANEGVAIFVHVPNSVWPAFLVAVAAG